MLDRGRNDPLYDEARELVIARSHPSAAFLQRHYSIGYNRATAILEDLEADGVVTRPDPANGKRTVQKPMPPADAVREALDALSSLSDFAYTNGYHELGYDPATKLRQEFAALTARAEAAERDAARYRWLRDHGNSFFNAVHYRSTGEKFDAAIDDAMQEPQP